MNAHHDPNQQPTPPVADIATNAADSGATPRPLDRQSFAIGILSITASVFFVGFLLLVLTPRPAEAARMNASAGDYLMATQSISNTRELIVVIDAAAQRMISYELQSGRNPQQLVITSRVDLKELDQLLEDDRGRRRRR